MIGPFLPLHIIILTYKKQGVNFTFYCTNISNSIVVPFFSLKTSTVDDPEDWWSWQPCGAINLHLQDRQAVSFYLFYHSLYVGRRVERILHVFISIA